MRQILTDACLAMLAAVGIWTLWRMILDRILTRGDDHAVWTVLCVQGSGEGLMQTVHWLLRRPYGQGVLLLDCGLDDDGRTAAESLVARESKVWLCPWERAGAWMKEAEIWTRQRSTTE